MVDEDLVLNTISFSNNLTAVLSHTSQGYNHSDELAVRNDNGQASLSVFELFNYLDPNATGKITIKDANIRKVITVKRKGLLPSTFKDLSPLYEEIAGEIRKNNYFTSVVPVVLWDASFTGEGMRKEGKKRQWADGTNPENNLYWGSSTGIYTQLKASAQWRLVKEESFDRNETGPIRRAVFAKTIQPNQFWKAKGINKPFEMYLVVLAFDYRDIGAGYKYFSKLIEGKTGDQVSISSTQTLLLDQNRLTGAAVHYMSEGVNIVGPFIKPNQTKGVFMASCFSATQFAPLLTRENLYPLFFSIPTTSAEGYIYLPVIDSVASGEGLKTITSNVFQKFSVFQGKQAGSGQYTNPYHATYETALSKYNDDWDGDGLKNSIDIDPLRFNESFIRDNVLYLELSEGKNTSIKLPTEKVLPYFQIKNYTQ